MIGRDGLGMRAGGLRELVGRGRRWEEKDAWDNWTWSERGETVWNGGKAEALV